ncbi:MAG TPA: hypothetical protein VGM11_05240, partial [Acidobacteriaceae bacterium]
MSDAALQTPPSTAAPQLLVLSGPPALTTFEADRLSARLRSIDSAVTGIDAAFFYILLVAGDVDSIGSPEMARLTDLLELTSTGIPEPRLFIAPRIGTQSPWSSKATDILHNTGFTNVQRIERVRAIHIRGVRNPLVLAPVL